MPFETALCRCGRRYQKLVSEGDWDLSKLLAWCRECAGQPWHDKQASWSRDAALIDGEADG
jgi:hypothetical protein